MKQKTKFKSGITLIALIITIVVLLILAGVTINIVMGDNGVLKQAENAKVKTDLASEEEKVQFAITSSKMNNYPEIDYEELKRQVKNEFGESACVDVTSDLGGENLNYIINLPNGHNYNTTSTTTVTTNVFDPIDGFDEDNNDVKIYGYKISSSAQVYLQLYFVMSESKLESGNEKLVYQVEGESEKQVILNKNNVGKAILKGIECYYYNIGVNIGELTYNIKISFYNGNTSDSSEIITSVKQIYNNIKGSLDEKYDNYFKALLYLGGMNQLYFGKNIENLASENISVDTSYITSDYLIDYKKQNLNDYPTTNFYGSSVSFNDDGTVMLNFVFNILPSEMDNYKLIIDGEIKSLVQYNDNYSKVSILVTPDKFNHMFQFYLLNSSNERVSYTTNYGVFSFAYAKISSSDINHINICRAMVLYSDAYNDLINN